MNETYATQIRDLIRRDFAPRFGELDDAYPSNPSWKAMRDLGSRLWLDTGSLQESGRLWSQEFEALTTNNTLLNREVQNGQYDRLIVEAAQVLSDFDLSERQKRLEMAFILNAVHGLKLVEKYDAYVSVEEHTDLANNVEQAVAYGQRYHEICPERFYVKLPLTPAGILATRHLSAEDIPVNHTLGFSARQNYLVARVAQPSFVNVFLGRLNSFVADNGLGDGSYVGEKACLASQAVIQDLRSDEGIETRQIAASLRDGSQVRDLAGVDVFTMPPKVAAAFLELDLGPDGVQDSTGEDYKPGIRNNVDPEAVGIDTLWDVEDSLVHCVDRVLREDIEGWHAEDLVTFFKDHECADVLFEWSASQVRTSEEEGKIPNLRHWREMLAEGTIGLDALMNLAGLNSFRADQEDMDRHVVEVMHKG